MVVTVHQSECLARPGFFEGMEKGEQYGGNDSSHRMSGIGARVYSDPAPFDEPEVNVDGKDSYYPAFAQPLHSSGPFLRSIKGFFIDMAARSILRSC